MRLPWYCQACVKPLLLAECQCMLFWACFGTGPGNLTSVDPLPSLFLWHQGTGFWDGVEYGSLSMHTWSNMMRHTCSNCQYCSGSSSRWPCQGCKNGGVLVSCELILVLLLTLVRCVLTQMVKGDLDKNNGNCNLRWVDLIHEREAQAACCWWNCQSYSSRPFTLCFCASCNTTMSYGASSLVSS